MHSIDFHAHHSPQGAYASFTCGRFGAGGGLAIEGAKPATQDLVIGYADEDGVIHALPFFTGATTTLEEFAVDAASTGPRRRALIDGLERHYGRGTDRWTVGGLEFAIHTPVFALPDPDRGSEAALLDVALPALAASVRLDNRDSRQPRTLVFGIFPGRPCRELTEDLGGDPAVGWGRELGMAAHPQSGLTAWVEWSESDFLRHGRNHLLGGGCGFTLTVPAGEARELQLVLGFHRAGMVTTGVEASYYYARRHPALASVLKAGLARFDALRARAEEMDREHEASALDEHQRFLLAHAERSYWGNTQLLDHAGRPLWTVLEGEYAMINTFDLTVDMCFYELARNPWTVRNVLDQFVARYSYVDQLARPQPGATRIAHSHSRDPAQLPSLVPPPAQTGLPGGLSFTHDMGICGQFTPPGRSSYELDGVAGCFSHMTAEQLLNWILTATSYVQASDDRGWLAARAPVVAACLASLLNRDDPDPARRTGIVRLDSSRCAGGWEITTYDSLDASLGQARDNLYMGTKAWAAWLGLAQLFALLGDHPRAQQASAGAARAAATIAGEFDARLGYIPAVFEPGNRSAIIPAIEGLVYPLVWGLTAALDRNGAYSALLDALDRHLRAVLRPGVCLFADHGWKLSSTSDNSWLSKIFICQHVAERVFGVIPDAASHAAHARWQQLGSRDWAMCDQCIAGEGKASRYYPRCVTAELWLAR